MPLLELLRRSWGGEVTTALKQLSGSYAIKSRQSP